MCYRPGGAGAGSHTHILTYTYVHLHSSLSQEQTGPPWVPQSGVGTPRRPRHESRAPKFCAWGRQPPQTITSQRGRQNATPSTSSAEVNNITSLTCAPASMGTAVSGHLERRGGRTGRHVCDEAGSYAFVVRLTDARPSPRGQDSSKVSRSRSLLEER